MKSKTMFAAALAGLLCLITIAQADESFQENFDTSWAKNPRWEEVDLAGKPAKGVFSLVNTGESHGNVAQIGPMNKAANGSLRAKIQKASVQITLSVKYRYPSEGADFSKVWIGIGTDEPGKDYSIRIADALEAYGKGNNAALYRDGNAVMLAAGDTGVAFDNEWHTIKLQWTAAGNRLQMFYDAGTKPFLDVNDQTYGSFTRVYIGGDSVLGGKRIQFDDVVVETDLTTPASKP